MPSFVLQQIPASGRCALPPPTRNYRGPGRRYARSVTEKQKHVSNEELIALGRKHGVEVTISTGPKGTGEIVALPGIRPSVDERRLDLLRDDDGSGVVE